MTTKTRIICLTIEQHIVDAIDEIVRLNTIKSMKCSRSKVINDLLKNYVSEISKNNR